MHKENPDINPDLTKKYCCVNWLYNQFWSINVITSDNLYDVAIGAWLEEYEEEYEGIKESHTIQDTADWSEQYHHPYEEAWA